MNKKIFLSVLSILLALLLISSCSTQSPEEAERMNSNWDSITLVIASEINASSFAYIGSRGDLSDSSVTLTFNGVRWSSREYYSDIITSYCAFRAFDMLADTLREEYKEFKIILNTDNGIVTQTHPQYVVAWAHLAWHVVNGYFAQINDSVNYALDTMYISKAKADSIRNYLGAKFDLSKLLQPQLTGYMPTAPYGTQWFSYWLHVNQGDSVSYSIVSVGIDSMRVREIKF